MSLSERNASSTSPAVSSETPATRDTAAFWDGVGSLRPSQPLSLIVCRIRRFLSSVAGSTVSSCLPSPGLRTAFAASRMRSALSALSAFTAVRPFRSGLPLIQSAAFAEARPAFPAVLRTVSRAADTPLPPAAMPARPTRFMIPLRPPAECMSLGAAIAAAAAAGPRPGMASAAAVMVFG